MDQAKGERPRGRESMLTESEAQLRKRTAAVPECSRRGFQLWERGGEEAKRDGERRAAADQLITDNQ